MTLTDALRHVAADPLRLIAVRHAWSPPLHTHGVGLLTDGRLVAKAKDGMSSAPYTATLADVTADDWEPLPLLAGVAQRAPAAGLPRGDGSQPIQAPRSAFPPRGVGGNP